MALIGQGWWWEGKQTKSETKVSTKLTSLLPPSVPGAAPPFLSARASGVGSPRESWRPRRQSWCLGCLWNLPVQRREQRINSVRRSAYSLFSHDDVFQQQEGEQQRLISHDSSCALEKKKKSVGMFSLALQSETVKLKLWIDWSLQVLSVPAWILSVFAGKNMQTDLAVGVLWAWRVVCLSLWPCDKLVINRWLVQGATRLRPKIAGFQRHNPPPPPLSQATLTAGEAVIENGWTDIF